MKKHRGFSLIELLVALSILAIVAAIVVPKLMNARQSAQVVVAQKNISELNNTYNQWSTLGGKLSQTDWNNVFGGDGVPSVDASWGLVGFVFGYLCEQAYPTIQKTYNGGATPQGTARATYSWYQWYGGGMSDSYGIEGSNTVQFVPNYIAPPCSMSQADLCGENMAEENGASPMHANSPDGFYLFDQNFGLYYKSGSIAYLVYFEPYASGSNKNIGFWIVTNPADPLYSNNITGNQFD